MKAKTNVAMAVPAAPWRARHDHSPQSAVKRARRRWAMSKTAFLLMLLWAVPIGMGVGVGVSEALQCHDIHSDLDRGGVSASGAWAGTIAGGPLKGPYTGQFVGS